MHLFINNQQVILLRLLLLAYLGQLLSVSGHTFGPPLTSEAPTPKATGNNASSLADRAESELVEIKIGFLVGSRRLEHDHTYSRPGRQLKYAFNYAIDKFNQFNSDVSGGGGDDNNNNYAIADDGGETKATNDHDIDAPAITQPKRPSSSSSSRRRRQGSAGIKIKFAPIIKETYGSESESIKQTIELITKHGVNFIFGPQETCQIEPKLASIFNVAMLSHYCTTWTYASSLPSLTVADPTAAAAAAAVAIVDDDDDRAKQRINNSSQSDVADRGHPSKSRRRAITMMATNPAVEKQQQQSEPPPPPKPQRQTFIQIKPPHWKIVSRVVALVEQILAVSYRRHSSPANEHNGQPHTLYPQQLVLLYFKELPPSSKRRQPHESSGGKSASASSASSDDGAAHLATANDAIQYRLIGELLEIKLKELLAGFQRQQDSRRKRRRPQPSLSALNWHTTFHYGYTKNPFRAVLRRHLFSAQQQRSQPSSTNQSSASGQQCNPLPLFDSNNRSRLSPTDRQFAPKSRSEAIYIVVGHYYEHLGLMLALNELNLLPTGAGASASAGATVAPTETTTSLPAHDDRQARESIQSSVGMTTTTMMMRRRSVVIGVDTEPYDERDDSVRFLRGLLMDSAIGVGGGGSSSQNSPMQPTSATDDLDLDSISALYRAYLGVVPAKPTHLTEFLDEIRSLNANETASSSSFSVFSAAGAESIHESANNQTEQQQQLRQLQLSSRLLQFIRLPVEAFYLYDAVMLLGLYLKDCLLKWGPNGLPKCSQGNRTFEWFRGRDYVSHVTHNWSRFDSFAQADGSYNLITRRKQTPLLLDSASANQDEDSSGSTGSTSAGGGGGAAAAALIPIGYFSAKHGNGNNSTIDRIELHLSSWDEVDPIWLPFWCHVRKNFKSDACLHLFQAPSPPRSMQDGASSTHSAQMDDGFDDDDDDDDGDGSEEQLNPNASNSIIGSYPLLTITVVVAPSLMLIVFVVYIICCSSDKRQRGSRSRSFNAGWFSESDEKNFLELIYKCLLMPEAGESLSANDDSEEEQRSALRLRTEMLELHCNMFAFPSCMFVHWLTAMHQLKEMLFKFKSKDTASPPMDLKHDRGSFAGIVQASVDKSRSIIRTLWPPQSFSSSSLTPSSTERQFFSIKHSGTNSLRLLLNKYKSINECLINLSCLDHESVAKLHGITMSCSVAGAVTSRTVYLILEQPHRGNLRHALKLLGKLCRSQKDDSSSLSWMTFKDSLVESLIGDLLDGLEFLHKSSVGFHGDLRSTTCLIGYDWRLKLSGFQANHLRRSLGDYEQKMLSSTLFDQMIYSAPELIQNHSRRCSIEPEVMRLADIYSFAFVAYELFADGLEPWSSCTSVRDSKLIVERVKENASFRPSLSKLDSIRHQVFDLNNVQRVIRSCWSHSSERRPQSIASLRCKFFTNGHQLTASVNELMCIYTGLIECCCYNQRKHLKATRAQTLELKMRLLPANIAARLRYNQHIRRQHYECVSFGMFRLVLASDSPNDPVEDLGDFVRELKNLIGQYQNHLHLLDSQADSLMRFMVYSGEPLLGAHDQVAPSRNSPMLNHHSQLVASFALQVVDLVAKLQAGGNSIQVRCGLHCGPAFGGLLTSDSVSLGSGGAGALVKAEREGSNNLAHYILIGPTTLVANVLEQTSQSQRIQISSEFRAQLLLTERLLPSMSLSSTEATSTPLISCQGYVIIKREAKIQPEKVFSGGRGCNAAIEAYWLLNGPRLTASQSLMLMTRSCDTPTANQSDDNSE